MSGEPRIWATDGGERVRISESDTPDDLIVMEVEADEGLRRISCTLSIEDARQIAVDLNDVANEIEAEL